MSRIGPRMREALDVVAANPGCRKITVALAVEPYPGKGKRGGLAYGYRTVDRCIAAGLVDPGPVEGPYRLTLTGEGEKVRQS